MRSCYYSTYLAVNNTFIRSVAVIYGPNSLLFIIFTEFGSYEPFNKCKPTLIYNTKEPEPVTFTKEPEPVMSARDSGAWNQATPDIVTFCKIVT